jgi:DNA-binding NtrC family response regulator
MSQSAEILLIDDDEMTLFIHQKILERSSVPFPFKTFRNAQDCISYLETNAGQGKTFILLLDINMPGMSGWDMLDTLQSMSLDLDYMVIMATSSVDYEDRKKSELYKTVIDFVEKPLTLGACEALFLLPRIAALG